jgi:hypothetical protein
MVAHDESGLGVGLVLAPQIEKLRQRISPDGESVHYLNQKGEVVLSADGRALGIGTAHEQQLDNSLRQLYGWSDYGNRAIYPRFRYTLPDVYAGFYALEENLTYNQIVLLRETLQLYDRSELAAFKPAIFHDGIAYIFYKNIDLASGLTYSGTGVIGIDRRDLFGNKYALASVLAHEGAHVLQGGLRDGAACSEVLRREIGDGTIPPGFYGWTAQELLAAVEKLEVGAYHVSLWMLYKLGLGKQQWLENAIYTGIVDGQPVVLCQPWN